NREIYLTPQTPLPDSQLVTVAVNGVTDVAGNAVTASATQFVVGPTADFTPPRAVATNPANGLTGVPTNAVIAVQLDEVIDPSTVNGSTFLVYDNVIGQLVTGTLTVSGDAKTIRFVPAAPLAVNRSHSVYFTGTITDLA